MTNQQLIDLMLAGCKKHFEEVQNEFAYSTLSEKQWNYYKAYLQLLAANPALGQAKPVMELISTERLKEIAQKVSDNWGHHRFDHLAETDPLRMLVELWPILQAAIAQTDAAQAAYQQAKEQVDAGQYVAYEAYLAIDTLAQNYGAENEQLKQELKEANDALARYRGWVKEAEALDQLKDVINNGLECERNQLQRELVLARKDIERLEQESDALQHQLEDCENRGS